MCVCSWRCVTSLHKVWLSEWCYSALRAHKSQAGLPLCAGKITANTSRVLQTQLQNTDAHTHLTHTQEAGRANTPNSDDTSWLSGTNHVDVEHKVSLILQPATKLCSVSGYWWLNSLNVCGNSYKQLRPCRKVVQRRAEQFAKLMLLQFIVPLFSGPPSYVLLISIAV